MSMTSAASEWSKLRIFQLCQLYILSNGVEVFVSIARTLRKDILLSHRGKERKEEGLMKDGYHLLGRKASQRDLPPPQNTHKQREHEKRVDNYRR